MFSIDLTKNLIESLTLIYPEKPQEVMNCVEIGSFEGKGSIEINNYLCENKDSVLFCIDPFDDEYVKGNVSMSFWDHACRDQHKKFKQNTNNYPKIREMKGYSDNMINFLDENSVDFCYVDGDHSPDQVYKDAKNILGKMKNNGVILFDDYLWSHDDVKTKTGIDKFLDEFKNNIKVIFSKYQLAIRVLK